MVFLQFFINNSEYNSPIWLIYLKTASEMQKIIIILIVRGEKIVSEKIGYMYTYKVV